jgi:NAD(P)-dependent dehydrogenase (short-subunit alcohol dehydrogenase family)
MPPLSGRVALVTGGSRGIGLAIARSLLERGASVAITATKQESLERAEAELAGAGPVVGVVADVRRYDDMVRAVDQTASRFGRLDVLVNNAGVGVFRAVADMTLDEWELIIQTNVTGVFHSCKAALPRLRERGGWIINVSSLSGKNPFADGAAYCASKAALNAFSEALMQEVRHDGVRVAYVLPGSVRTGFSGREPGGGDEWKLAPEDVAEVVTDLLAHPTRSLPSRVEIRPSRPPKKG